MSNTSIHNRASDAVMGAFIGDALGFGPHWYYDLAELRRDHGDWIDNYTRPRPGRYHAGIEAGQLSQAGLSGIPQRFLDGIDDADQLQHLAMDLAAAVHTP